MEYQINNIFIEKLYRKCEAKAGPRPLNNFGNSHYIQEQPLHSRNYFKGKIF